MRGQEFEVTGQHGPDIWRTEPRPCPACGQLQDALSEVDTPAHRGPDDGSYVICANCQEVSVVQTSPLGLAWRLRPATVDELITFNADPVLCAMRQQLRDNRPR